MPDGLIAVSGRSWTEEATETAPRLIKGEFDLRVVNFDQLTVSWVLMVEDARQREEFEALVAVVLRLLGEKREAGDGAPEYVFRIELDSAGKVLVNGEDPLPRRKQLDG